jgi:hypothetical protein
MITISEKENLKQKPNLLTLGCSHSGISFGTHSWADFISSAFDYNLIRASSNGAGNSFYLEKLNYVLQNNDINLVVIQLTDPSRVVLGLSSNEKSIGSEENDLISDGQFGDLGCYTWNVRANENNIKNLTGHVVNIDKFFIPYVMTSNWIDYKVQQDICTMQYMCDSFNVPCIFWSWFVSMEDIFNHRYSWLKSKVNYIDGWAEDYMKTNNIASLPDNHYGAEAHAKLCDGWLIPEISRKFNHLIHRGQS